MTQLVVLQRCWRDYLGNLLRSAEADVVIACPYVTQEGTGFVAENISASVRSAGAITVVTDLSPLNVSQGSTDPNALRSLTSAAPRVAIHHLPRLHAKVYVADGRRAIVTSGNLTGAGLTANYEYGLGVEDAATAEAIRRDIADYAELGAEVGRDELSMYCSVADRVRQAFREQQRAVTKSAREMFDSALREAGDELIRLRVSGGAIHPVFAKTILYLLKREGPLTTEGLHQMIERIHPDLCDNTVDRVIGGVRFGKKWKHAVRTAQQHLKHEGLVTLRGDRWMLAK